MSRPALERFFQDCEFSGPLRLATRSAFTTGGPWDVHEHDAPFAVVGSDPRCDIVLETFGVAPRHCYLQAFGPRVICVDLRRGDDPRESGWLDDRVGLRVGPLDLIREPDEDQFSFSAEDVPLVDGRVSAYEIDIQTRHVQADWRMKRPLALIGSARGCALRLSGPRIAGRHAALVLTGTGLWVVDLLGQVEAIRGGSILVNGEPTRFARLGPDDVLEVGKFRLTARPLSSTGSSDDTIVVAPTPAPVRVSIPEPPPTPALAPEPIDAGALWSAFEARLACHSTDQAEAFAQIHAMLAEFDEPVQRDDAPPAAPAAAPPVRNAAADDGGLRGLHVPVPHTDSPFAVSVIAGLNPSDTPPTPAEPAGDVS